MPAALQSITIPRTEKRSTPSPHVVYAILVSLPVRNWTIYRRYSEFLKLHEEMTRNNDGIPPPFVFPAKQTIRKFWSGKADEEARVKERREVLEAYLRGIVLSQDEKWRVMDCFLDFIELPKGGGAALPKQQYVPGSYSHSQSHTGLSTTRQLGPAQETATTRQMTSDDLFTAQQAQFDQQDSHLDDLTAILRRQRQMGMAINQELLEQNELLEALDGEVQETQGKLTRNDGLVRRLG